MAYERFCSGCSGTGRTQYFDQQLDTTIEDDCVYCSGRGYRFFPHIEDSEGTVYEPMQSSNRRKTELDAYRKSALNAAIDAMVNYYQLRRNRGTNT